MDIKNRSSHLTVRNLVFFSIVVIAIGWVGRGLDVLMGNSPSEGLGILLWIVTPLAASLLLRGFAGDGWKDFGINPCLKGNLAWYAISLLVYPVVTVLVLMIGCSLRLITLPGFSLRTPWLFLQAFVVGLLPMFIKNILEEFPWRGYLAPKVYSLRLNHFVGHFIVGIVWGVWHVPYFLFFLDRAVIHDYTALNLGAFIPLAIVVMISWAIVYGEIRILTNSVWPAVLMHMVEDAFLTPLMIEGYIRIEPGLDWLVSPAIGVISIILFAVIGVGLNQLRKRKELLV